MLSRSDKSINVSWFYFVFKFKPKDEGIQNANVLSTKSSFVYRFNDVFSVCPTNFNFRSGNCRIVSECIVISLKQFSKFEYTISDLFLRKSTDNQEYSLHCIAIDLANTIS